MHFINEYRRSIKNVRVEELVDLAVYRPLAYLLVAVLKHTPVTPNQISLMAMVTGIISGCFLALGDRRSMSIGGLLYGLSNVLDCSDGMMARIKKNGTKTGRIVDGAVDYVVSIAVYIGFALGLMKALETGGLALSYHPWLLIILAGLSALFHAILSDKYRNLYEGHVNRKIISPQSEIYEFEPEYERLKREGGSPLDRFLIGSYLHYCRLQAMLDREHSRRLDPAVYGRYNNWMVMLWNLIGSATHISILMLAAILYEPQIFFWYTIIWANLWVLLLFPVQIYMNHKVRLHMATRSDAY